MSEAAQLDRRRFLILTGGCTAAAAMGCASLPRRGSEATAHPCRHRHCRYHLPAGGGRCSLAARVGGGVP